MNAPTREGAAAYGFSPRTPYGFTPRTHRWSVYRRLAYGLFVLIPLGLLVASMGAGLAHGLDLVALGVPAILIYVHVGWQFLVLMVLGHLLAQNRSISDAHRMAWGIYFLVLAPAACIAYWYVHIWHAEGREERRIVVESDPVLIPDASWRTLETR